MTDRGWSLILGKLSRVAGFGLLVGVMCSHQPAQALTDYMYFSVNGDTSVSAVTQGEKLTWTANCDSGSTVRWEIWYDANSNSLIDPATDVILGLINSTDGDPLGWDADSTINGWVVTPQFTMAVHPGAYIFEARDFVDASVVQRVLTSAAMASPAHQLSGHITVPGHPAPDSLVLKNVLMWAEQDGPSAYSAMTDENGAYTINLDSALTGVRLHVAPGNVTGFSTPPAQEVLVSGATGNIDFTYGTPVDSVYGFLRAGTGAILDTRGRVIVENQSDFTERDMITEGGRYAHYFAASELGEWQVTLGDEEMQPVFLDPDPLSFSHDTLNSFRRDITVYRADATIYARVREDGALPTRPYLFTARSSVLAASIEAASSGIGINNIAQLRVSSYDPSNWTVMLDDANDDFPLPPGLIWDGVAPSGVSLGDTVTLNLIPGNIVSDQVVQDPGDAPVNWDDVNVWMWDFGDRNYGTSPSAGGFFSITVDTGGYWMGANADGYVLNPSGRNVYVTGDTTGDLGFDMNRTHCRVTGTLVNVPTPISTSDVWISAYENTGYDVSIGVDSSTATYEMYLCDGDWTVYPWSFAGLDDPDPQVLTIGEPPDTVRIVDFVYTLTGGCPVTLTGDVQSSGDVNSTDIIYLVNYVLKGGPGPVPCPAGGDANCDGVVNSTDIIYLVNYVLKGGQPPCDVCTLIPGTWSCP
jgi:hypothetical protein